MSNYTLEQIRELCERATPGPWHPASVAAWNVLDDAGCRVAFCELTFQISAGDAAFIAASREIIPQLLAEVERLTKWVDDAGTALSVARMNSLANSDKRKEAEAERDALAKRVETLEKKLKAVSQIMDDMYEDISADSYYRGQRYWKRIDAANAIE